MSDYKNTNLAVQSNTLIRKATVKLKLNEQKVFETLLSCIDTKHPPKDNTVFIKRQELLKATKTTKYDRLKKYVDGLQNGTIIIKGEDKEQWNISIIQYVHYPKENSKTDDTIEVQFTDKIMPYLADFKELFTQYSAHTISYFKSSYTVAIYKYLLSLERQYRYDDHVYIVRMDDLRRITDTEDKLQDMTNFENRVLKIVQRDINHADPKGVRPEFMMKYEKIRQHNSKAVTHIKFTLRKRTSVSESSFEDVKYIERLNDKI